MRAALTVLLCLAATAAGAQARPSTPALPCARAAGLVQSQGAIVLGTGGATYDRFVNGSNHCVLGEFPEPAFVPSADNPQCFVGYRCRNRGSLR
ncbi:MAG TPA: hypothetical protein VHL98_16085 [Microvirga sp.]|jgi:hypothetical protein|nr:hypothetical protein [Microvirga sp.]